MRKAPLGTIDRDAKAATAAKVDNYADDSVLDILTEKRATVAVTIITDKPGRITNIAVDKFIAQ